MSDAKKQYEPFGEEWKKYTMCLLKKDIIDLWSVSAKEQSKTIINLAGERDRLQNIFNNLAQHSLTVERERDKLKERVSYYISDIPGEQSFSDLKSLSSELLEALKQLNEEVTTEVTPETQSKVNKAIAKAEKP